MKHFKRLLAPYLLPTYLIWIITLTLILITYLSEAYNLAGARLLYTLPIAFLAASRGPFYGIFAAAITLLLSLTNQPFNFNFLLQAFTYLTLALLLGHFSRALQATSQRSLDLYHKFQLLANLLQAALKPAILPRLKNYQIAEDFHPGQAGLEVGGDFYEVYPQQEDWIVVLGDVMGSGPEPAVLTALARDSLRVIAKYETDPQTMLERLNQILLEQQVDRFLTAIILKLSPHGEVTLAHAGHPPPLLLTNKASHFIEPEGMVLGMLEDTIIETCSFKLSPEDTLFIYTDGFPEAKGVRDRLGLDGLRSLVEKLGTSDLNQLCKSLSLEIINHGYHIEDDAACLAIKYCG